MRVFVESASCEDTPKCLSRHFGVGLAPSKVDSSFCTSLLSELISFHRLTSFPQSRHQQTFDVACLWTRAHVGTIMSAGIMTSRQMLVPNSGTEAAMATKTVLTLRRSAKEHV